MEGGDRLTELVQKYDGGRWRAPLATKHISPLYQNRNTGRMTTISLLLLLVLPPARMAHEKSNVVMRRSTTVEAPLWLVRC